MRRGKGPFSGPFTNTASWPLSIKRSMLVLALGLPSWPHYELSDSSQQGVSVHLAYIDCSNLFIEAQKVSAVVPERK